jgi:O-antigen/teichoic acid export membrane protein
MFLHGMNKDDVERYSELDWKAIGYITSIVSVFFLGAIAWPRPNDPGWQAPVLIAGMALSILGMGFRYLGHIRQKKEMSKATTRRR